MREATDKIFIIAGEASGDLHASNLVKEIKKIKPGTEFTGVGGKNLKEQGVKLVSNYSRVNYIGFTSVARHLPEIKKVLNDCVESVKHNTPDIVILVDFPGFNLKFAEKIRKFYTGKIIYYISPQLWAWHKSRVKKIREFIDKMLVVFPFEVEFYKNEGVEAQFVGHPLVEIIDGFLKNNRKQDFEKKQIGLLPGSREEEIRKILPVILEAGNKLKNEFDADLNLICSSNIDKKVYEDIIGSSAGNIIFTGAEEGLYYRTLLNSDVLFAKTGTSTMECTLIGSPYCVVYRANILNYFIGRMLIQVDHIAMANILMGKEIVKEFIQSQMNVENLYSEGKRILTDTNYKDTMLANFKRVREILTDRSASRTAAEIVCGYLK